MKIEQVAKEEVPAISKYGAIVAAITKEDAGEYLKISGLDSGKQCVTVSRYLRNKFYMEAVRLNIRIDAKHNTIYVAKVIE